MYPRIHIAVSYGTRYYIRGLLLSLLNLTSYVKQRCHQFECLKSFLCSCWRITNKGDYRWKYWPAWREGRLVGLHPSMQFTTFSPKKRHQIKTKTSVNWSLKVRLITHLREFFEIVYWSNFLTYLLPTINSASTITILKL